MFDMMKMMSKIKEAQEKMKLVKEELDQIKVKSESGAGLVKVEINGKKELVSIQIDESILNERDMVQDLVVAATNKGLKEIDSKIKDQLKQFEKNGYGNFPICIAKTQYSFSTDPNLKGAPSNHSIPIREVRLSSGAEFIVVVCGEIMTMPGLPSIPAANSIKLNNEGEIEGLF